MSDKDWVYRELKEDKILYLAPQMFKAFSLSEDGAIRITLDLKKGWGPIAETMINLTCELAGHMKLASKIRNILFVQEPFYKIVSGFRVKDRDYVTKDEIKAIYLEMKKSPCYSLSLSANQLMEELGIDAPKEV